MKSAGSLPSIQGYPAAKSTDGDVVAGPFLGTAWVDSKDMLIMEYSLDGEQQDCKLRPLVFKNGSNETLTPPGNSTYTTTGDGVTGCEVVIVDSYTPNN